MLITKEKRPDTPSRHAVMGLKFKSVRLKSRGVLPFVSSPGGLAANLSVVFVPSSWGRSASSGWNDF